MIGVDGNTNPEVIRALLDAGANIEALDDDGRTPLLWAAAETMNPEILQLLLARGARIEAKDSEGQTALMLAVSGNPDPRITEGLIAAGANVEDRDQQGATALMLATTLVGPICAPGLTESSWLAAPLSSIRPPESG